MLLNNRIALITGGANGIGKAIAKDMAKEGAIVIIADISEAMGRKTVDEIKREGGTAHFVECNVLDSETLTKAANDIEKNIGIVDILIINAGISINKTFDELTEEIWDRIMDVNLKGSFLTVKAFIDHIKCSKFGKILFISSGSVYSGTGSGIHYVASKAGQNAMVLNLAKAFGPLGINVNAIAPRVIQTEMLDALYPDEESKKSIINKIPIRKIGQPEDVAYLATFLSSDKSKYIHGQVILLDGGRTYQ